MEDAAAAGAEREDALRREAMSSEERLRAAEMELADLASNAGDSTKPLLRQIEAMAAAMVSLISKCAPSTLDCVPPLHLHTQRLQTLLYFLSLQCADRLDSRQMQQKQRLAFLHVLSLQSNHCSKQWTLSVKPVGRCGVWHCFICLRCALCVKSKAGYRHAFFVVVIACCRQPTSLKALIPCCDSNLSRAMLYERA